MELVDSLLLLIPRRIFIRGMAIGLFLIVLGIIDLVR